MTSSFLALSPLGQASPRAILGERLSHVLLFQYLVRTTLTFMPSSNMGKRYYCDFCDKSFTDNPPSRRNHLRGLSHKSLRAQHYAAFKGFYTVFPTSESPTLSLSNSPLSVLHSDYHLITFADRPIQYTSDTILAYRPYPTNTNALGSTDISM